MSQRARQAARCQTRRPAVRPRAHAAEAEPAPAPRARAPGRKDPRFHRTRATPPSVRIETTAPICLPVELARRRRPTGSSSRSRPHQRRRAHSASSRCRRRTRLSNQAHRRVRSRARPSPTDCQHRSRGDLVPAAVADEHDFIVPTSFAAANGRGLPANLVRRVVLPAQTTQGRAMQEFFVGRRSACVMTPSLAPAVSTAASEPPAAKRYRAVSTNLW